MCKTMKRTIKFMCMCFCFWNFHVFKTLMIFSNLVDFIFSKLVVKIMWTSTFVDENGTCHINFFLKCPQC
jgi:hypothetical protein